jgi:hypothetical protein
MEVKVGGSAKRKVVERVIGDEEKEKRKRVGGKIATETAKM